MSDGEEMTKLFESIGEEDRTTLTEFESKRVLSSWGLPVVETRLATDKIEAVNAARDLKYPVVMKVSSPGIIRKSDVEGVKVGLSSEIEVRQAFEDIISSARIHERNADIQGVVVQRYVPDAREVVVGVTQDRSFGPTAMFGLAGVWAEVLEDISFRLAPVSEEDAREMIGEINGYQLLLGSRGRAPADIHALVDIIQKTSELPEKYREISEVDLNPVFVFEEGEGATVIDAQITLKES